MSLLPLLEFTKTVLPRVSMREVCVIGAQHILPTTRVMFEAMRDLGLSRESVHLLGKCYSTDPRTLEHMQWDGYNISDKSSSFENDKAFDVYYTSIVERFFDEAISKVDLKKKKVVIMDDGGYLLTIAQKKLKGVANVVGLEQTSSGYEKVRKIQDVAFPIVNVARSAAKLVHESPLIADSIADKVFLRIEQCDRKPRNILIIGRGAIGSAINDLLTAHGYRTSVYDKRSDLSDIEESKFLESLSSFDMLVGCTGTTALKAEEYKYLKKGCMLVSASSSDREFDAAPIRAAYTKGITDCHTDLHCGSVNLTNCGFPINFDGNDYSTIDPPHRFQLTRSLLTLGVFQACALPKEVKGLVDLDHQRQTSIVAKFQELTRENAEKAAKITDLYRKVQLLIGDTRALEHAS